MKRRRITAPIARSVEGMLAGWIVVVASGCTLLNAPSELVPRDAGVDGWVDGDAEPMDGDADADVGPCVLGECPERCDDEDGDDEDGDGLANCADFECVGHPACCAEGGRLFAEGWDPASYPPRWRVFPSGDPYPSPGPTGTLEGFPDDRPSGMLRTRCMPLALGIDLLFEAFPLGDAGCSSSPCEGFAALAITAADGALPGTRIASDLAITVRADGRVDVTSAGNVGPSLTPSVESGERLDVRVTIAPGVDSRERAVLFATVGVRNATTNGEELVTEPLPFVLQRSLLSGDADCVDTPGLYLAVEGQGDRVRFGALDVKRRECANPSHFRLPTRDTATLTSEALGLGAYAEGGLDAPALACSCDSANCFESPAGTVRWDVLAPGTNVSPELEKFTHVGYALGHAVSVNWNAGLGWIGSTSPKAGNDPPTCLDDPSACASALSHRDPALLARVDASGRLATTGLLAAYARERDPAVTGTRDVFAIHVESMNRSPSTPLPVRDPVLLPSQVGCISLRDPELIEAGPALDDGFWLLFTCQRAAAPDEIRAVWMSFTLEVDASTQRTVLRPEDLGRFAERGVRGVEAIWERDAKPSWLLRLWFVAEDRNGTTTVGFAQGQAPSEGAGRERFPALIVPYQGNPILAANDPRLGECPEGSCPLLGLDVVRRADDSQGAAAIRTLRFLVARRVNLDTGLETRLVPLEQSWRAPQ